MSEYERPNGLLTAEEYDVEHSKLVREVSRFTNRVSWILRFMVVLVLAIAVFGTLQFNATSNATERAADAARIAQQSSNELQANLVRACKTSPVRAALIAQVQADIADTKTQISQAKQTDYTRLFPGFPPHELQQLLNRQRDQQIARIARDGDELAALRGLQCEKNYNHPH